MLRHREMRGRPVPAALLYSCRRQNEIIYHHELVAAADRDPQFRLLITLTRQLPEGWSGGVGRITLPALQALLKDLGGDADTFVCGNAGFVEAASGLLVQAGLRVESIRTERFGPSGA